MNTLWTPPRLHQTISQDEERRVTWLELFYDLVYVATLIQLGNVLSDDVSVTGLVQFVVIFIPVWWAWTGITFYMNRFVVDDVWHRGLIYLQICAIAWLGVSVDGAFGELATQFALTYAAIRLILVVLYVRTWKHAPETRPLTQRYVVAHSIGVVLWMISAFMPAPLNYGLWLVALAIEIGNIFLPKTRQLQTLLPPAPSHMAERYGIFTIIVLGESFIKTITAASGLPITFEALVFSLFGIGAVFGLWWLYFDDVAESDIKPAHFALYGWIYAHLPLAISLTMFGVAAKKLFLSADKAYADEKYLILFCVSMMLYTLSLALLEYVTSRRHETLSDGIRLSVRLGTALVFLLLALLGGDLSPILFIIIVAVIMMIQIGLELISSRRKE